jgi:Family of unknown function (DUF6535)
VDKWLVVRQPDLLASNSPVRNCGQAMGPGLQTVDVHQYHDSRARARLRLFRYLGIHGWSMFAILASLPLFLQFALIPFFVGVIIYIARSSGRLAMAVGALLEIVGIVCTIYMTTIVLPFVDVQCPYRILPINAIPEIGADKETSAISNLGHVLDANVASI